MRTFVRYHCRMTPRAQNPIVQRIDDERERLGWSREEVARRANLSRDFIRKLEQRGATASLRQDSVDRIAAVLGVPPEALSPAEDAAATGPFFQATRGEAMRGPMPPSALLTGMRDLPVMGTAAGALTNGFEITRDVIDYVYRPPSLFGAREAYAIYVISESMVPLHNPGDLCFVHPGRPLKRGDSAIIQVQNTSNGPIEAYIKTFLNQNGEWLHARQLNPPSDVDYLRSTVLHMHKVMTMNDLFGA